MFNAGIRALKVKKGKLKYVKYESVMFSVLLQKSVTILEDISDLSE